MPSISIPKIFVVEDQIVEAMNISNHIKNFGMEVAGISADIANVLEILKKVKVD